MNNTQKIIIYGALGISIIASACLIGIQFIPEEKVEEPKSAFEYIIYDNESGVNKTYALNSNELGRYIYGVD